MIIEKLKFEDLQRKNANSELDLIRKKIAYNVIYMQIDGIEWKIL